MFYLGTHQPHWLTDATVPLFVSHPRLRQIKTLPKARTRWALDSGGFTELRKHGRWTVTPADYVAAARRYAAEIGPPDFAAPQDWMCEPEIIHGGKAKGVTYAGTGLSVIEHQRRTVDNFLELRQLAPELPFIPVIQGWTRGEHLDCADMYQTAGVDLAAEPLVGVGSVCRKQGTVSASLIFGALKQLGLRLHGFGVKTDGLRLFGEDVTSADSMAWSYGAYRAGRDLRCPSGNATCSNCLHYALEQRSALLAGLPARWDHPTPQAA